MGKVLLCIKHQGVVREEPTTLPGTTGRKVLSNAIDYVHRTYNAALPEEHEDRHILLAVKPIDPIDVLRDIPD